MTDSKYILSIESSCDETAVALVARDGTVLINDVASQIDLHAPFGGVVPEVAARRHIEVCLPLIEQAMHDGGVGWDEIEAVGVTYGPGLIGCLLVGVETAKTLAWIHHKPLVAVNHLGGHLYAPFLKLNDAEHLLATRGELKSLTDRNEQPPYPHLGLIVSGGHTSLVYVASPTEYETIAQTRDDAAGEAYDKAARLMGLGYPGGPLIDKLATEGNPERYTFTPPMLRRDKPDFSFSGLKTAMSVQLKKVYAELGVDTDQGQPAEALAEQLPDDVLRDLCAGFQSAVVEALIGKCQYILKDRRINDLVITGGVACNRGLRARAAQATSAHKWLNVWFPHPSVCTDNAAMIGGLAWHLDPVADDEALRLAARSSLPLGGPLAV